MFGASSELASVMEFGFYTVRHRTVLVIFSVTLDNHHCSDAAYWRLRRESGWNSVGRGEGLVIGED